MGGERSHREASRPSVGHLYLITYLGFRSVLERSSGRWEVYFSGIMKGAPGSLRSTWDDGSVCFSAMGTVVLDGQIYVCGGYDGNSSLNSVETYSPETDK